MLYYYLVKFFDLRKINSEIISGFFPNVRVRVSPAASAMKLRKAALLCEILEFSCLGFFDISPYLGNINCNCNQCGFCRFRSKPDEKQIGRQINEVIMQIFVYVSRSY